MQTCCNWTHRLLPHTPKHPNKKLWAQNQITTVGKNGHTWHTVDIWNPLFENLLTDEKSLHLEQSSHYAGK
jgi:hypothetical protein